MLFTLESCRDSLLKQVPPGASGLLVAYSGGVDSTVLLHALAALRADLPRPIRAIHIDHQLHADSAQWAKHCRHTAADLGIPFEEGQVLVTDASEHGVEAAARSVRYAALRKALQAREVLLTAHHADDQAETLLLALMRGTGVRGLAGMPPVRAFGAGWHARPLLSYRRAVLLAWAREQRLHWLQDPSNANSRFARNFIRAEILPHLEHRWPSTVAHLQSAARSLQEATELLDDLAQIDFRQCGVGRHLNTRALHALSDARQRNLLRWWLRREGARAPSRATLAALRDGIVVAAPDRVPHVDVDGLRVFRHREVLYAEPIDRLRGSAPVQWRWREPLVLGEGCGRLRALEVRGEGLARARLPEVLTVRARNGGERLRTSGASAHRTLKNLLQEADVLPWWRERLPLLHAGERLCAVADLWIAAEFRASSDEPGVRIVWEDRPEIFAARERMTDNG